MKKIFLTLTLLLIICFSAFSQWGMATSAKIHGHWSNWILYDYENHVSNDSFIDMRMQYNDLSNIFIGMTFMRKQDQSWDWFFKFEIDNYVKPDKKTRKQHQKNKSWYVYSGWVEYFVSDDYPTIQDVLEHYLFPRMLPKGDTVRAKRRAKATIKIAPYKKYPTCFNIFFDDIGVGISFQKFPFDRYKSYFIK